MILSARLIRLALPFTLLVLGVLAVVALGAGDMPLSPVRVWAGLWHRDPLAATVIWQMRLPRVAVARTLSIIGKDTVPAMQSGLYWGYIALIEGLVIRIKAEFGAPMTVIATGGLGRVFYRQTPVIDHYDPDLTIRGLVQTFARNKVG